MREYELTVLIHPDLEADLETPLTTVRDIVTANGGKIVAEDNWGKKRLAYRIAKEDFAVYVHMEVELPATGVAKVDQTLNITDSVLAGNSGSMTTNARANRSPNSVTALTTLWPSELRTFPGKRIKMTPAPCRPPAYASNPKSLSRSREPAIRFGQARGPTHRRRQDSFRLSR